MTPARRRITAGLPFGAVIALLVAFFAARANRAIEAPERGVEQRSAPAAAPSVESRRPDAAEADAAEPRGPGFTSRRQLVEHYEKHGEEFPGFSMAAYLGAAQRLRDAPAGDDVLEVRRPDGVITRFDRGSGAFLAANRDGTIRTFFKPNDGERYFRRQASRATGGGS
ncbi:MAG TPA: hypothetical protein VE861_16455 [Gemmatimonadaceae bacterium]|nr:hypothetical protein [Gemmatimonadaceae bacterium]